jgi:hypothetical protein
MSKLSKREGPDPVAPLVVGNVRYEVPHWIDQMGGQQNGGFLVAYDLATNERLWVLQVYETAYDPQRERDVQDVFITRLSLGDKDGELQVEDEDGHKYLVNIHGLTVTMAS